MIEIAAAIDVIKLVVSSIGLVDKVYDSWHKYVSTRQVGKSQQTEFFEKISSTSDNKVLVHSTSGVVAGEITAEDLRKKLSPSDVGTLDALEKRMEIHVHSWNSLVVGIELETNLVTKATYQLQLDGLKTTIAHDLKDIFRFVEFLGFKLGDHYGAARFIAGQL